MKVLQVTAAYYPAIELGGPIRSVASLASGLALAGHSVNVLTTNIRGLGLPPTPTGTRVVQGIPVHYCAAVGASSFLFSPRMASKFLELARGVDLVHLHSLWMYPLLLAARLCQAKGIPYVITPRGTLDPYSLSQKRLKKVLYYRLLERANLRRAALLHYTADDERDLVPAELHGRPSVVIPNAIDAPHLLEVPPKRLDPTDLKLIMVGRIHSKKGFDRAIPALRAARDAGLGASLTIVGPDEGGYRSKVEAMCLSAGVSEHVRFAGLLDSDALAREYERADVLLMPSYQENFGMSAAEAMLAGRPVIVSNAVNIASEITTRQAGLAVPLEASAIAAAIQTIANAPDEALAMGQRGREYATKTYSVAAVGLRMAEAYRSIL